MREKKVNSKRRKVLAIYKFWYEDYYEKSDLKKKRLKKTGAKLISRSKRKNNKNNDKTQCKTTKEEQVHKQYIENYKKRNTNSTEYQGTRLPVYEN